MTNQTTNGDQLLTAKDQLERFVTRMETYLFDNHLDNTGYRSEMSDYSDMSLEQLRNLTQQDMFNAAFLLYEYAEYVSYQISKNLAIINWCNSVLNKAVSHYRNDDNVRFSKPDLKEAMVAHDNSFLTKVLDWKVATETRNEPLKTKEFLLRKKADLLLEKGKRQ